MKNMIKVLVGSISLAFGGTAAAGIAAAAINGQPTTQVATENTVATADEGYTLNSPRANTKFALGGGLKALSLTGLVTKGIEKGGINLIGAAGKKLGIMAFKAYLSYMGVDVRSSEMKALDKIQSQIGELQESLQKGVKDVKRTVRHLRNADKMDAILDKLATIDTPVAGKMATMMGIAAKETEGQADSKELAAEKDVFYKGLDSMKFTNLDGTSLWNQTQMLAQALMNPSRSEPTTLMDIYDDTLGTAETWDYMTIAPRRKFIGYVGTMVNSMAQLSIVKAAHDVSKLAADDPNILDYQAGIDGMIRSVNNLNDQLKKELEKLTAIEKKHDDEHIITHRDATVDKDGVLTFTEGRSFSTKLLAVTTDDNDDNKVLYDHNEKNKFVRYDCAAGAGAACVNKVYTNFVYTLDCTNNKDLYKTVFEEFENYKKLVTDGNAFTMKDYLKKVGFSCDNQEGFEKAKGFYSRIDTRFRNGNRNNWWRTDERNDLRAYYYDFNKAKFEETPGEISETIMYKGGWFSDTQWSSQKGDQVANYYLVFVDADQKTVSGKVVKTDMGGTFNDSETYHTEVYNRHYKGHSKWDGKSDKVTI